MSRGEYIVRHRRPLLTVLAAACFFAWAVQQVIVQRAKTQRLTHMLGTLQQQQRILQDERRSLFLEYVTATDYARLRAAASDLRMREPRLEDGSLVFIGSGSRP